MAMTPAEKMAAYRKRLKEKGGKVFVMTLSPEELRMIEIFGQCYCPGLDHDEVIRAILASSFKQVKRMLEEEIKLTDDFNATKEFVEGYKQYVRWDFELGHVLTAEQYLDLAAGQQ